MEKREKILLILVAIAAVGAGVYLLSHPKAAGKSIQQLVADRNLNATVIAADKEAKKDEFTDLERYKLVMAEKPWTSDPFYDRDKYRKAQDPKAVKLSPAQDLKYTGFVILDAKRFAVINGLEYEVGDELDKKGLFITSITEQNVIIGQRNEQGAVVPQFSVPITEDALNLFN